jgi:hypothetical protein
MAATAPTRTAAEQAASPLTADEQLTLEKLLARASAVKTPATRIGEPYEALVNLSVPRRGDKDHGADLVYAGETVYLTDEEARQFERHGARDGRVVAVIRKLSGPDGSREPLPRLLPRHVSGLLFRPQAPAPNSDLPRPDPEGSSRIQVIQEAGGAPEAKGAMSASPEEMRDHLSDSVAQDALDLPPGARTRRG